jgi:hypothetical protein
MRLLSLRLIISLILTVTIVSRLDALRRNPFAQKTGSLRRGPRLLPLPEDKPAHRNSKLQPT